MRYDAGDVPADDRSFLYGDGIFETLLVIDGRIAFASQHLQRLRRGAQRLAIDLPADPMAPVLRAVPERGVFVARLTLSRGSGPRGYASRGAGPSLLRVRVAPLARDPFDPLPAARLGQSGIVMAEQPLLAGIKHCNRLEQVLAADEAQHLGVDECLLLNASGSVQCAIAANVFLLSDGRLITPPCDKSGVAGTRRALVLERVAACIGVMAQEGVFDLDDVHAADGLLLTSTTVGIRIVASFGQHRYQRQNTLLELQAAYGRLLRQCLATS